MDAQTKQAQVQGDIQIKVKQVEIDAFNAETKRIEAETKRHEAAANIDAKRASAQGDHIKNASALAGFSL